MTPHKRGILFSGVCKVCFAKRFEIKMEVSKANGRLLAYARPPQALF